MTPEQQAAFVNAQTAAALIEMETMKLANQKEYFETGGIRYQPEEFTSLLDKYELGYNNLVIFFRN